MTPMTSSPIQPAISPPRVSVVAARARTEAAPIALGIVYVPPLVFQRDIMDAARVRG
jgi:hypothetical protein